MKSRAFLHFHEDQAGLFADIRACDQPDFDRLRVESDEERAALMATVEAYLNR